MTSVFSGRIDGTLIVFVALIAGSTRQWLLGTLNLPTVRSQELTSIQPSTQRCNGIRRHFELRESPNKISLSRLEHLSLCTKVEADLCHFSTPSLCIRQAFASAHNATIGAQNAYVETHKAPASANNAYPNTQNAVASTITNLSNTSRHPACRCMYSVISVAYLSKNHRRYPRASK